MATVSENPEIDQHYVTQVALTAALYETLAPFRPELDPSDPIEALQPYMATVSAVVGQFQEASISFGADFYEDFRADMGVTSPFRVPIADPWSDARIQAYLNATTTEMLQSLTVSEADEAFLADMAEQIRREVEAEAQKLVADAGRGQVEMAVEGDDLALGFARVARPDACAWCLSQAFRRTKDGRLGVYKSRESAGQIPPNEAGEINRFHTNCQCVVVPIFTAEFPLDPHLADMADLYSKATANSKPKELLNDFRRALAAVRRGETPDFTTSAPTPTQPSGPEQLAALLRRF